ncbi:hypothetical protein CLOHIR_00896 [Peptacetobacter hiranonis DSM 13275]|uniref:Uncharacterized protein n=1 Tax=Peptacetobacter hiranonis (strain DSM 13275 / JCM 10541 / KCTC 15199 / TO-931) TaxID=500633 RepID=B6FYE4_PEPHT|nr:hypothetical protein CLOHIR_00896 [Peptacetobacter hiranonis DSM 13275]
MYSRVLVTIILAINNIGILFTNGDSIEITSSAPKPYIGQNGPFKNPLLTNFFCPIEQYVLSHTQPRKLYIVKYNTWRYKTFMLKITSFKNLKTSKKLAKKYAVNK